MGAYLCSPVYIHTTGMRLHTRSGGASPADVPTLPVDTRRHDARIPTTHRHVHVATTGVHIPPVCEHVHCACMVMTTPRIRSACTRSGFVEMLTWPRGSYCPC
eukprot:2456821-Alexandrium_andersonii.AAC.1